MPEELTDEQREGVLEGDHECCQKALRIIDRQAAEIEHLRSAWDTARRYGDNKAALLAAADAKNERLLELLQRCWDEWGCSVDKYDDETTQAFAQELLDELKP